MRENAQVNTAWAYSDINRLYNNELGPWAVRYVETNMMPYWVGVAAVTGTASTMADRQRRRRGQHRVPGRRRRRRIG